jgi:putative transposase
VYLVIPKVRKEGYVAFFLVTRKRSEAMRCLEEGLEDSLRFYNFPEIDKRRISSTNVLERTNREIRRRSRVVGVFLRLGLISGW